MHTPPSSPPTQHMRSHAGPEKGWRLNDSQVLGGATRGGPEPNNTTTPHRGPQRQHNQKAVANQRLTRQSSVSPVAARSRLRMKGVKLAREFVTRLAAPASVGFPGRRRGPHRDSSPHLTRYPCRRPTLAPSARHLAASAAGCFQFASRVTACSLPTDRLLETPAHPRRDWRLNGNRRHTSHSEAGRPQRACQRNPLGCKKATQPPPLGSKQRQAIQQVSHCRAEMVTQLCLGALVVHRLAVHVCHEARYLERKRDPCTIP